MNISIFIYIALAIFIWNIVTFSMYGIDKDRAKNNKWRISEATLIICAFLMGGIGALLGMAIFRHKTKHIQFQLLIPLAVIVNIGVSVLVLRLIGIV